MGALCVSRVPHALMPRVPFAAAACFGLALIAFSEGDQARAVLLARRAHDVAVSNGLEAESGMAVVSASAALCAAGNGDAFDPRQNIDAGVRHLKSLLENYNGNVELSLAAYNAGSGAVRRNGGIPPFRETRDYVKKITDLYHGSALRPRLIETRDADGHRVFSNND